MYVKFYEVWTIIFKVIAISGYSGVYFRLKYLHAIVHSDFLHLFAVYF